MLEINKEQITSVERKYKKEDFYAKLIPEGKTWYGKFRPAKIKTGFSLTLYTVDEYFDEYDNRYLEDGKIYRNPYILIDLSCGETIVKHFKNKSELDDWYDKNLAYLPLLKV